LSLDSTRLGSGRRNSLPIVVDCSRELYKGVLETETLRGPTRPLRRRSKIEAIKKGNVNFFFFRFYLEPAPPFLPCLPSGKIFSSRPVLMTFSFFFFL
jgi:hypothetical protein